MTWLVAVVAGCMRPQATPAPEPLLCWATRSFGAQPRILVDLRLRSGNENRVPSPEDVRAVTRAGGIVVYQFRVAVLRAVLDTSALRTLLAAGNGVADVAYPVVDSSRRDVRIQVFYQREMRPADDSALTAIGARELFRPPRSRNVSATVPDSLVPAVERQPGVSFVRAHAMVCAVTTRQHN